MMQFNERPSKEQEKSIFKNLIVPLLSSMHCGGFMIFASPTIYIEDYSDEPMEEEEYPQQMEDIMMSAHAEMGPRDDQF